MTSDNALLERVRNLLAKAEGQGVTAAEAEALTAKAAELMARHGIDRAMLAADQPGTDRPADRVIDIVNPWGRVQAHLLCGLASTLRCQSVILPCTGPATRIHLFGFASDLERTDILYTSVLVQMWQGLAAAPMPGRVRSVRAWRRSWLLGFAAAVVERVRAVEQRATAEAMSPAAGSGSRAELVLADRQQIIERNLGLAYPMTRRTRITYSGSGYGDGFAKGSQADLGSQRLRGAAARALGHGDR
jgi:hypothetical protein